MTSYVYFIKPIGKVGPIKIGCSIAPKDRLSTLMTWSPYPLELVVTIPGGRKLEKNIHECFGDLHTHREWFRPGERLLEAIEMLKLGLPVEQAIDLDKRVAVMGRKPTGGAGWSDLTRQKMSVMMTIMQALKKIGLTGYWHAPDNIRAIRIASEDRILTERELSALEAFADNPEWYREECWSKFRKWQAEHRAFHRAPTPSPRKEAV